VAPGALHLLSQHWPGNWAERKCWRSLSTQQAAGQDKTGQAGVFSEHVSDCCQQHFCPESDIALVNAQDNCSEMYLSNVCPLRAAAPIKPCTDATSAGPQAVFKPASS
jgi:hypothetical protein